MGEQSGDKSEEPTPHRLKEARDKGQVAKSKEVTTAFLLLTSYVVFRYSGGMIWNELSGNTKYIFEQIPNIKDFSPVFAGTILLMSLKTFAICCAPLAGVSFVVAIIAEAMQTGLASSTDPLTPKLERINPLEGFKRLLSMQGLVELVKSLVKIFIVFWITWYAVKDDLPFIISIIDSHPWEAVAAGGNIAFSIAMRVGIFYLAVAILDYFYRRFEYMKNLRMTKQEIKEEYKRLEGDPLIKQRIRDLQRQAAYQRMMSAVPGADVIVTNPTHLAVALQYDASKMKAPVVLAKGKLNIAEEIKKIAENVNIPIIENEELARAIFSSTKVGNAVPGELYQAVAEVLAFVYKLKKDRIKKRKERLGPLRGVKTVSRQPELNRR